MRLLLDTHVFIWWLQDRPSLGRHARTKIAAPGSHVYVSAASLWEMALKIALKKLRLRYPPGERLDTIVASCSFEELPVRGTHAAEAAALPLHHADPFDRMLIAQARVEGLTVVTADEAFEAYGVPLLDATA